MDVLIDNNNIIIDNVHRVLFCAIPKAACSSWKAALALLTQKVSNTSRGLLKSIHFPDFMAKIGLHSPRDLNESRLHTAVENYTNILVVRHPFERLLSAYRDKFLTYNKWTKHFQFKYGRKIALLYRGDAVTRESLLRGDDVTFEEFLRYIVDETVPFIERSNPHWNTYHHLCHPCIIPYNHVIKFETLDEDNAVVLGRHFDVRDASLFFPKRNMKRVPSRDIMVEYYSKIPRSLIYKIYDFYREDMQLFGYELSSDILPEVNNS